LLLDNLSRRSFFFFHSETREIEAKNTFPLEAKKSRYKREMKQKREAK
jgi:hypothetical protein